MTSEDAKLIRFLGIHFWFMVADNGEGALARLEDCDKEGNPQEEAVPFAWVTPNGDIVRHNEKIGTVSDLERVAN